VTKAHEGSTIRNREVREGTERCEKHMSECDDQMRRYEKQLKDVQETMKRGEIIN
jgi:chaperonin cofactor prefoldin